MVDISEARRKYVHESAEPLMVNFSVLFTLHGRAYILLLLANYDRCCSKNVGLCFKPSC